MIVEPITKNRKSRAESAAIFQFSPFFYVSFIFPVFVAAPEEWL